MNRKLNILICPLEWGLGHVGRMIPLAGRLREMNNNIIIGAGEEHLTFFRSELPGLSYIHFPGFRPGYSRFLPQYLLLLFKSPVLLFHIIREHLRLKSIIQDYNIDIVISDNRFGLWNKKIKTVYITHMPLIPLPKSFRFLEFSGIYLHRFIIKKYSLCFIPDLPGEENISGRLSHGMKIPDNVRYIGLLSRFTGFSLSENGNPLKFRHNTVILSGPEPQRGILRQKLVDILNKKEIQTVMLEVRPGKTREIVRSDNIIFYNHLTTSEMSEMITGSESIITRAGYTTIMELISLNCSAVLIPTPGQTEQEYLAEYLSEKGWFTTVLQKNLKIDIILPSSKALYPEEMIDHSKTLFDNAVKEILEK